MCFVLPLQKGDARVQSCTRVWQGARCLLFCKWSGQYLDERFFFNSTSHMSSLHFFPPSPLKTPNQTEVVCLHLKQRRQECPRICKHRLRGSVTNSHKNVVSEPEDVGRFCIVLMVVLGSPARLMPGLGRQGSLPSSRQGTRRKRLASRSPADFGSGLQHLYICGFVHCRMFFFFKSLERGSCVVRPDCARHFAEFSFLPPPKARIPTLLPSPPFLLFFFKLSSVALGCFSTFSSHVSIIRSVALLLLSCLAAVCWALLWCSPGARSLLAWSHTPSQAASKFRSCRSRLSEVW